ncbi:DUF3850 domain-containing protein [Achromobacter xylosoxidans]|uniref:DUF3850 domain-containing protein n=1 Tax=Alcaligenes xylosoxydans xylosoxydans TaxID=85698 RepID=UPI0009BEF8D8|nr:DUF3850 domain-containing protein [Achromobacter xylosoxidans]
MTNQNNAAQAQRDRYHILKTDPEVFQAVLSGAKTFEIRLNDRGFAVGDVLGLRETKHTGAEMRAGAPLEYTGRECQRFVSHVLTGYGLADGWCCLSFRLPHAAGESTPVADEPPGGTRWPVLRAMARNYTAGKHTWDALDANACEQAAEEIRHLRAALASAPVAGAVVAWAAVPSRGKRAGRIYSTCDTREEIDAYIEQVHQSNDSLTLWARPLSFADTAPQASAENVRKAVNTCGTKVFKALAAIARADGPDTRKEDDPELLYRSPVMDEVVRIRRAYDELGSALKQPQASNACGGALTDDVALPPLPAELRDTETHSREYARAAVLFDRLKQARGGENHV